ncbi:DUF2066 domain-containing protein [Sneathiella marina]|uniref:DUF2066 domain-containing protein n=1 Tax=Sneathiella marina TaxID=2950108 RepID=A0ABY4VXL1_9PROT|nr:DUF2066 domain-containing protein [Sneathiella marina]USG59467.1 DUF2066 domain-containing protein [Sneathiella marina]
MTDTKRILSNVTHQVICVLFISFLTTVPAHAVENDQYTVRDISVDTTAATIPQAQTKAIRVGQRRAFYTLLRKLVPVAYHLDIPVLQDEEITPLVAGFQVANERTAPQRYLADLTFEFKRQEIRDVLRNAGLPFAEAVAKPLLVLPVFNNGETKVLWEEPNPWRTAWVDVIDFGVRPEIAESNLDDAAQTLSQPVIVPAGDFADIQAIDVQQAVSLDEDALGVIEDIYETPGTLIISARLREDQDGRLVLEISRQRSGQFSTTVIDSYIGTDDPEFLMQSAILDILQKQQDDWKQQNIIDFSVENTLAVTTTITGLEDWLHIQEQVKSLSSVSGTRTIDLSVAKAFWHVTFLGSIDQLRISLAQQDLQLVDNSGYWTLDPVRN